MIIFTDENIVEQNIVDIQNKNYITEGISLVIKCNNSLLEILLEKSELEKAIKLLNQ